MPRLKDKKITILQNNGYYDEYGQFISVWDPLPGGENIWAYYRQSSAQEFFSAAALNYKVEAIFEINWRDDIDTTMKILFRGKEYNITRIDNFEGNKQDLRIYAYSLN